MVSSVGCMLQGLYASDASPIHVASTGTVFPLAWSAEDNSVPGVDVTQAYIDADVPPAGKAAMATEAQAIAVKQQQQRRVAVS